MQWVAAQDSPQGEPTTSKRAVVFDRGHRKLRTAWREAARAPQKRAEQVPVKLDQKDEHARHNRANRSQTSSRQSRAGVASGARNRTMTSTGGKRPRQSRKASRTWRLKAFRSVARLAKRALTAIPSLGPPSFRKRYRASTTFAVSVLPVLITSEKESLLSGGFNRPSQTNSKC